MDVDVVEDITILSKHSKVNEIKLIDLWIFVQ